MAALETGGGSRLILRFEFGQRRARLNDDAGSAFIDIVAGVDDIFIVDISSKLVTRNIILRVLGISGRLQCAAVGRVLGGIGIVDDQHLVIVAAMVNRPNIAAGIHRKFIGKLDFGTDNVNVCRKREIPGFGMRIQLLRKRGNTCSQSLRTPGIDDQLVPDVGNNIIAVS